MATPLAYAIDTLAFDGYVNRSSLSDQSVPAKIRPHLTMCIEPVSKRILAFRLSEHHPDRESIKAILYEAFFADDENKHSASVPDEIWFDKSVLFSSLQDLIQALHLTLCSIPPSAKGLIERLFFSIQNACFPGKDGSGNRFIAESALSELEERFAQFLLQYHHQVQSSTGLTPLESWQEQRRPSAVDPRMLSLLLCDGGQRRVVKDGIHYLKNRYWHSDLARYMGKEVHIRKVPTQITPETLEVFFEQQWICSASLLKATNENDVQEAE
jgi:Mu transposase, C-terminal